MTVWGITRNKAIGASLSASPGAAGDVPFSGKRQPKGALTADDLKLAIEMWHFNGSNRPDFITNI
jgi:hypothetical protein